MTPRAALTKHLLDGDDSLFRSFEQPPMTPTPEAPAPQPIMTPQKIQPVSGPAPFDPDAT
jgi:sec-independent protein translocase protein TatB